MSIIPRSSALVQVCAPELEKRCRPHLRGTRDSWCVDETWVKVKGMWMYLYRAVDFHGKTIEFFLSATHYAQVAKHFLRRRLALIILELPRHSIDKNAAYPKAHNELKAERTIPETCEVRQ